jgi:SnoaL-like domain
MNADALTATLHAIEAREEIRQLRAIYCWHVARGDAERIVQLFAPDGMFEIPRDGTRTSFRGFVELLAFFRASLFPGLIVPFVHNDVIHIDGDAAAGTCVLEGAAAWLPKRRSCAATTMTKHKCMRDAGCSQSDVTFVTCPSSSAAVLGRKGVQN